MSIKLLSPPQFAISQKVSSYYSFWSYSSRTFSRVHTSYKIFMKVDNEKVAPKAAVCFDSFVMISTIDIFLNNSTKENDLIAQLIMQE